MLREEDWVPRSVRERVKLLERTFLSLEGTLGRPATEEEISSELGMDIDSLHSVLTDAGRAVLLSLDDIVLTSEGSETIRLGDIVQDHRANTDAEVEINAMKTRLGECIDRLPGREKLVISLYYYDGLTFKEIGKILEIGRAHV